MLAIRMQRTGRRGHTQFRVIVQDSHFHPTRGKVVAYLGSYNPHTKATQLDKELAEKYLGNGAQPSDRAAKILKEEGVKLPNWVTFSAPKQGAVRNADKRRSTRPAEPKEETAPEEPSETPVEEPASEEAPTEERAETPAEESIETSAEEPATKTPEVKADADGAAELVSHQ